MAQRLANWKRSRLATGGTIVLLAGLWTGPQMADAASVKPAETGAAEHKPEHNPGKKPTTTTTVPPTTTTTTAPPEEPKGGGGGSTTSPGPGNGTGGGTGGGTTTTPGPGTGTGGGGTTTTPGPGTGTGGGGSVAPPPSGGTAPSTGTPSTGGGSAPAARPSGGSTAAPRSGPRNFVGPATSASAQSVAPPDSPGESTVNALRGPDGAAQATARSMGGSQGVSAVGGPALYAQLAASPVPSAADGNAGNPYITFTVLTIFGLGICFTGRRRVRDDEPVVAFA